MNHLMKIPKYKKMNNKMKKIKNMNINLVISIIKIILIISQAGDKKFNQIKQIIHIIIKVISLKENLK